MYGIYFVRPHVSIACLVTGTHTVTTTKNYHYNISTAQDCDIKLLLFTCPGVILTEEVILKTEPMEAEPQKRTTEMHENFEEINIVIRTNRELEDCVENQESTQEIILERKISGFYHLLLPEQLTSSGLFQVRIETKQKILTLIQMFSKKVLPIKKLPLGLTKKLRVHPIVPPAIFVRKPTGLQKDFRDIDGSMLKNVARVFSRASSCVLQLSQA